MYSLEVLYNKNALNSRLSFLCVPLSEARKEWNLIWKQWKRITPREKALIKLGVEPKLAHQVACTRKGYYQICKTTYVQFAINTERLRKRGLVFLLDQYTKVHIECTN